MMQAIQSKWQPTEVVSMLEPTRTKHRELLAFRFAVRGVLGDIFFAWYCPEQPWAAERMTALVNWIIDREPLEARFRVIQQEREWFIAVDGIRKRQSCP